MQEPVSYTHLLETYCDKKLQNLTPSERMVLKEPIFTGEFLGIAIAEENFFQDLEMCIRDRYKGS